MKKKISKYNIFFVVFILLWAVNSCSDKDIPSTFKGVYTIQTDLILTENSPKTIESFFDQLNISQELALCMLLADTNIKLIDLLPSTIELTNDAMLFSYNNQEGIDTLDITCKTIENNVIKLLSDNKKTEMEISLQEDSYILTIKESGLKIFLKKNS